MTKKESFDNIVNMISVLTPSFQELIDNLPLTLKEHRRLRRDAREVQEFVEAMKVILDKYPEVIDDYFKYKYNPETWLTPNTP